MTKKSMLRGAALLLALLLGFAALLPAGSFAASANDGSGATFSFDADFSRESLGEALERYFARKKLDTRYIAIGWVDLESGEEWYYNPDVFFYAGSTYKFPLAMLYLDKVDAGELSLEDKIGSYSLERDLEDLIVDSSNIVADVLKYNYSHNPTEVFRDFSVYSGLSEDELPKEYYHGALSARFVIGALRTLYENADKYALLIDYMKRARPTTFFNLYNEGCEIAHKYGSIDAYACDSGIFYMERPFLLTVLTHNTGRSMTVIGEIGRIVMDYAEYLAENVPVPTPESVPAATPTPAATPIPESTPAPAPESADEEAAERASLARTLAVGGGVALFALSALLFTLGLRKKKGP